ncbi:30S ribosomal protein S27e [Candidatus Pacearchaeota archaeon]|nr:30S ribosomal protein S27e [Candidatus Pacearchaeota archaeon]
MPQTTYLLIRCPRCNHHQEVYSKASTHTKCNKCNKLLSKPTGGKTRIKAEVKNIRRIKDDR